MFKYDLPKNESQILQLPQDTTTFLNRKNIGEILQKWCRRSTEYLLRSAVKHYPRSPS